MGERYFEPIRTSPRVVNIKEVDPVTRGDDIVFPQPYAGIVTFHDGRYVVAGRERGRLVLVGDDDVVISSGDPLSLRHNYEKTLCYGIAEHIVGDTVYMLVGEEGSTELWIVRIEILPDNTFKWMPTWDIRLPSVAARNRDYIVKKPVHFERGTTDVLHPMGFLKTILPPGDTTPWDEIKDATVMEFADFHQLGPILPEYHPSIAPMGARMLIGVTHAQVFQITVDLCITYSLGYTSLWEAEKKRLQEWLAYEFPNEHFVYGKEHDWWLERMVGAPRGTVQFHFYIQFQYPAILSSLILIHPDMGTVENITHVGSSLICPVADRSEAGYPASELYHQHYELKDFINVLTTACEADISIHLARQEYYIPSNPLTWSNNPPPMVSDEIGYAHRDILIWWVRSYLPYMRKLDPVAFIRQRPQPTTPILMASLREGDLQPQVRARIERGKVFADYPLQQPAYPWNDIEGIEGASREICNDITMAVTKTRILSGKVARHVFETYYEGKLLGRGLDIYVGKVLKGVPKIVQVRCVNDGSPFMHLREFEISLVADFDYPYFQYTRLRRLSSDPWDFSISYPYQLQPAPLNGNFFTFEVKIESDSTVEDPKPILLDVTYKKTGQ